jgi:hypothetical protein
MNNILQLKGPFNKSQNTNNIGVTNLPKGGVVYSDHLCKLKEQLKLLEKFWQNEKFIGGALVSVHYKCIVAKSNRLRLLLSENSSSPNESIRGAKFVFDKGMQKHVFTYFISLKALQKSIQYLDKAEETLNKYYEGEITDKDTIDINKGKYNKDIILSKSCFLKVIYDCNYVEDFKLDRADEKIKDSSIVTIYKTGIDTVDLLGNFGIDMINAKMFDETTLRLDSNEIEILQNKASYLIAMHVNDLAQFDLDDVVQKVNSHDNRITIPTPKNEPIIGVIDTHFDTGVYFHEWVTYQNMLDPNIELSSDDFNHGTAVSSIIVDGPSFNPNLEDGCGRFRVKHFGVAKDKRFSSFTILKLIKNIVASNRDIKVWNLSLGSAKEIDPNFISPEGALLDKIQCEYDVIFVVAGTNKTRTMTGNVKIGAPADSLNSLIVNSVDFNDQIASYTRTGPVLSFFYKPDVCYYGGDKQDKIKVCEPLGMASVCGTSYAAPWIARKIAYLMHIVGFSREVAKALIIDSAAGWNRQDTISFSKGYGIVPKDIKDIIHSKDDEIKFIMSGTTDEYETYTYNIPVPIYGGAHPFFAKATLAYFPMADRNQGVDYTSTELDLHFGRINIGDGKAKIKSINSNKQADEGFQNIFEDNARKFYRKWDNIKHISEEIKEKARPRKLFTSGMWGLSVKTKERLSIHQGKGLRFGVVITLKEMNGVNRIDEFTKLCLLKGWLVNIIDIQNQIDIYNKLDEEIIFENVH